ncbi:class I SAM-dependent methyltransferase [Stieleria sp. JC731]|uniref:class I SAM-dependent methyltransferase n=1 Tax=Pirellulaceae TaxID=2691357 RepID=UPI001E36E6B8|nr:class I SAM-dependent methyltransferase [Stieleria sp. JC731]MCC9602357.1 class I SAM-dependent methyltransferase [Stieleria sp. JC731]
MTIPPQDQFRRRVDQLQQLEHSLEQLDDDLAGSAIDVERILRQTVPSDEVMFVAHVLQLQTKARRKLGDGFWWCDERSLAQSTPSAVAELKSSWLPSGDSFDLCCGIGADGIAFSNSQAHDSTLQLVDLDPTIAAMARRNLDNHGSSASTAIVRAQNVEDIVIANAALHLDPDRRSDNRRTTQVDCYSPPWSFAERCFDQSTAALVKIAPASIVDEHPERHRAWISLNGSVREQTILSGEAISLAEKTLAAKLLAAKSPDQKSPAALIKPGGRSAISLRSDSISVFHITADIFQTATAEVVQTPKSFIIDPDAAIRAATLTESFAQQHDLSMLGGPTGFLTSDTDLENPAVISKQVLWTGSSDDRKLRKTLRQMNSFPQRVKTRSSSSDANALERRYRTCGEHPITLWIGKAGRRQYAVISEA